MSKAGIQAWFSTNCIAGVARSSPVNSGTVSNRVSAATPVANHRAGLARPLPNARVRKPPMIGSQISRLSKGSVLVAGTGVTSRTLSVQSRDEHGQQHDRAEDHRERVVVEETRLHLPGQPRDQANSLRTTVDRDAVDHVGVDRTRGLAEPQAAAGETVDPQRVEAVLVLQHADRPGERVARAG